MAADCIDRALKRLENCEVRVIIRGGKIAKIPCQVCTLQSKDGVKETREVVADITEE